MDVQPSHVKNGNRVQTALGVICKQSSHGQVRLQPNPVGIDDQARRDGR